MANYSPPDEAGTPTNVYLEPDAEKAPSVPPSAPAAPATPGKGWSDERRAKHSELIRRLAPWAKSTGPRTTEGKARAAANLGLTIPAAAPAGAPKNTARFGAAGTVTKPHRAAPAAERISMIDTVRSLFTNAKARRERQRDDLRAKIKDADRQHRDAIAADDDAGAEKAYKLRARLKGDLEAVEVSIAETARQDALAADAQAQAAADERRQEALQARADYQRGAIEFEADILSLAPKWQAVLDLAAIALAKERAAGIEYLQSRRQLPTKLWTRMWLRFLSQLRDVGDGRWALPPAAPVSTHESVEEFISHDTAAAAAPRTLKEA